MTLVQTRPHHLFVGTQIFLRRQTDITEHPCPNKTITSIFKADQDQSIEEYRIFLIIQFVNFFLIILSLFEFYIY